jgi:2,3-bisphosphoglycerate-independent phosphoglycerate mutase
VHAFTDGRDVAPSSAREQIAAMERRLPEGARIATVTGGSTPWTATSAGSGSRPPSARSLRGEGERFETADAAIAAAYARGETDEFVSPSVIGGYEGVAAGDGLLFTNFRADRARQILRALVDPEFDDFDRGDWPGFAEAVGMVAYSPALSRAWA